MAANIKNVIEERLAQEFLPLELRVDDESWQHGGGPNAQSHFKVVIVSERFDGMKLLARHRQIQSILSDIIHQIRALSLHTLTPQEWQTAKNENASFRSPGCHNH